MATGEGIEKEEPKAWEGHWNETVAELVRCSMATTDALTILLTGRNETHYADVVNRICNAKKLDFDLIVLKPEVGANGEQYPTTMAFKQAFLHDLVFTYKTADDIKIYEDRPKHVKGFREYFEKLNKSFLSHPVDQPAPPRKPINCEVIHVCELKAALDPKAEVEVIQRAIDRHNQTIATGGPNPHKAVGKQLRIVENYLYFAYLINETDSARLISLTNVLPHLIDSGEVRYMASSILIAPYKPRKDLLQKVGGRGKKVMWQVNGIAKLEDRIWAARVVPVDETVQVHTQDQTPVVVLAVRKGSRPIDAGRIQNWQPVSPDKAFMFQTTVGDKVMLRVDEVDDQMDGFHQGGSKKNRRKFDGDGGFKRKFGDEGDLRGKENWLKPGERDDGTWMPKPRASDRHGQARHFFQSKSQFNNRSNPNAPGNPGVANQQGGPGNRANNGKARNAGPGGGSRNRGGNRAPAGYKSLDDYGPGNFDGANDSKGQPSAGQMVMDY